MDGRFRFAALLGAALFALAIGVASYNIGVERGLAAGTAAAATSSAAAPGAQTAPAPNAPYGPYGPYGWYRPWRFGFFGPFALILFWFLIVRLMFWGGFRRRRWYYPGPYGNPAAFDEWHRHAHDRMNAPPPSPGEKSA
jgi:hypothetical protein